jgi:hypothetical protein
MTSTRALLVAPTIRRAEVVLEHARGQHRRDRGKRAGGEHAILAAAEDPEDAHG